MMKSLSIIWNKTIYTKSLTVFTSKLSTDKKITRVENSELININFGYQKHKVKEKRSSC